MFGTTQRGSVTMAVLKWMGFERAFKTPWRMRDKDGWGGPVTASGAANGFHQEC